MNIHRSPVLLASTIALLTLSMHSLAWDVTAHICFDDDNGTADGNVKSLVLPGQESTIIQLESEFEMTEGSSSPTVINGPRTRLCTRFFSGSYPLRLECKAFANEVHGLKLGFRYCSRGKGTAISAGVGNSVTRDAAPDCKSWQGGGGH